MSATKNAELKCNIAAIGAWGKDFTNWQELQELLTTGTTKENTSVGPKPEVIPANERRRAPLPVRLAVESSWQACEASDYDAKNLACVFVSGLGDTQLTDYMCKVLAGDNMQLSPTKFHNSVHNAAAGYWTISTGCMKAANSVAGFNESVSLTLLEAITQCVNENIPVLMTFYDAPASDVLLPLLKNKQAFSVSIIIEPFDEKSKKMRSQKPILSMTVSNENCEWPSLNTSENLQDTYSQNPVARILALLEKLTFADKQSLKIPLSSATSLDLEINNH